MAVKKKATNKLVVRSFFKTVTVDGKTEQVTVSVRRTFFFDDEETIPFSKIRSVEVEKNIRDSIPDHYVRYGVSLHLTDGRKIIIDEVGESSHRGGFKEMKNLGKKISMITNKLIKVCE